MKWSGIGKFSIPHLVHATVRAAAFPDEWYEGHGRDGLPADREGRVLKLLYRFAGQGIQLAPRDADLEAIPVDRRHGYLLQERAFGPVIATREG